MIGETSVVTDVRATDSATSALGRLVITFGDVPPKQQPTRFTPAATSGGIGMSLVKTTASNVMIRSWPRHQT